MLKRSITYTNPFTDEEVTEEHHFHISKADLVEMEMEENKASYTTKDGKQLTGMQAKLQKIVDSEDGKAIMAEFKDIIRRSYGKRDGISFLKSNEIWEKFASTEAYSQLIFEICTNANAASEFINGIIPSNMEQIAAEVRAQTEQAEKAELAQKPATTGPLAEEREAMKDDEASHFPTRDSSQSPEENGPRLLTQDELSKMEPAELKSGLAEGRYKLA